MNEKPKDMNSKRSIILALVLAALVRVDGSKEERFPQTLVTLLITVGSVLGRQERYPAGINQVAQQTISRPPYGRPPTYGGPVGGRPGRVISDYRAKEFLKKVHKSFPFVKGGQGGGGGGDLLGNVLQGVQFNVLDAKFIGLGFVREDLVGELCIRATNQLLEEGESRAQEQVGLLHSSHPEMIFIVI